MDLDHLRSVGLFDLPEQLPVFGPGAASENRQRGGVAQHGDMGNVGKSWGNHDWLLVSTIFISIIHGIYNPSQLTIYIQYLFGGFNMNFIFYTLWDVILPIDFHIFQDGF